MMIGREQPSTKIQPRAAARSLAVTAAVAVFIVGSLAGCSAAVQVNQPPPTTRTSRNPAWLFTRSALSYLTRDPAIARRLRGSQVYELLQPGQQPLAQLKQIAAKPVITFTSATALEQAILGRALPARTYGVLYDPEAWSFTPASEQRDPLQAAIRAAAAARAHGLRLIVAPALNLTKVLESSGSEPRWRAFLELNLAGRLARIASVIDLQAQSLERNTATYTAFVRAASSQARATNPTIEVLAGLSTNPPGEPVDAQHLQAAIQATRSTVNGYWLNIPGQGQRCPTCNAPSPEIAIQALQTLHSH